MIDLLNGKKSLAVTYWVGIGGFGLIWRISTWFMTQQYLTASDQDEIESLDFGYKALLLVCTIVALLLLRAMFKAGFNNRKPGGWGWLGIAIAGLGAANVGFTTATKLDSSIATPRFMLMREIVELNKQLPQVMDAETTLNGVEIIGDDLVYFFSYTFPVVPDMIPEFKRSFTTDGIEGQSLCRDLEGYFNGGLENVKYELTYTNQTVTLQLTAQDCLSFLAD